MSRMNLSNRGRDQAGARRGTQFGEIARKRTLGGFALVAWVIAELACTAIVLVVFL